VSGPSLPLSPGTSSAVPDRDSCHLGGWPGKTERSRGLIRSGPVGLQAPGGPAVQKAAVLSACRPRLLCALIAVCEHFALFWKDASQSL
jgi:hypothetical protein